ncbi:FAD-dependent oxidoreductase [Demequina sp. SYSU T00068]|uniref:protoporphyrinogen/coproporphyrinogen oxidase n=1 Tax=Demequina lignilytica TaxID=3051663 RepID=UPI002611B15D|nr:FAD-dependent oxidoreductase [Demequina sp. SYSU T00068]MDN4490460.1 FAD-dependent oxidoreductase [Demequina sp. SYSU T00068]
MPARVIVVGGGVAGLLAARRHARDGAEVTVLEAADRWGGRVSAHEVHGLLLDAGAESFATRSAAVADLARGLGLGGDLVAPTRRPAWVVSPDRAYALPITGWLGIPTRPLQPDVRRVIGWAAAVDAALERGRPLGDVADDATVGSLVRSRLGERVARMLVAPVLQGVYSRPLDELPLAAIDPTLPAQLRAAGSLTALAERRRALAPAGSAVLGVRGGIWRIAQALADAALADGVRLLGGTEAESVVRADGAWHVRAGGGTMTADTLVLATTAAVAGRLVPALDTAPEAAARRVALVTLVLDAPALDAAPRGTGVLATDGVTRAKALTHATAKWRWLREAADGLHVVRLSYALPDPDEDVAAHALDDAARLLGVPLAPPQVRASRTVVWDDASPARVPDRAPLPGLELVGSAAGLSGLAAIVGAEQRPTPGQPARS